MIHMYFRLYVIIMSLLFYKYIHINYYYQYYQIKSIFIIHQYTKHKNVHFPLTHGLKTQEGTRIICFVIVE